MAGLSQNEWANSSFVADITVVKPARLGIEVEDIRAGHLLKCSGAFE
jgi:hypothetical protein